MSDFARLMEMALAGDAGATRAFMGIAEPEDDKKAAPKPAEHHPAPTHPAPTAPAATPRR